MSEAKISVHVETFTDQSYVPSFTVKMRVTEAEGLTPCIFVHKYVPKCGATAASYEFMNVAYYDELNSVPDYLGSRKEVTLLRMSEVTKGLPNSAEMEDFIATVQHDIQRLLVQVNTTAVTGACRDVEITAETITQTLTEDCENQPENRQGVARSQAGASGVVVLNFDGTTVTEN